MEKREFSQFIADIYSQGSLILSISIGHDLGLFKVFYDTDQPIGLQDIADKLHLKERYTQEWLSCMVAAGILQQDRGTNLYTMPESHKEVLKVKSSFAPGFPVFARRTELVKQCFHKDGPYGFRFEDDASWFQWDKEYKFSTSDHTFQVDLIPKLKEQGMDVKLDSGITVLDIGCGVGSYIIGFAKRYPKSHFTGLDYTDRALEVAKDAAEKEQLGNVRFVKGDAHNLPQDWSAKFDWVYINDVLHDLPDPYKALDEVYKVMKNDGSLTLVEKGCHSHPVDNIGNLGAAMYYSLSMLVCLPSSMAEEPHMGYGACWGVEEIEKALRGAKFKIEGTSSYATNALKVFFFCTKS